MNNTQRSNWVGSHDKTLVHERYLKRCVNFKTAPIEEQERIRAKQKEYRETTKRNKRMRRIHERNERIEQF